MLMQKRVKEPGNPDSCPGQPEWFLLSQCGPSLAKIHGKPGQQHTASAMGASGQDWEANAIRDPGQAGDNIRCDMLMLRCWEARIAAESARDTSSIGDKAIRCEDDTPQGWTDNHV